MQDKAENHPSGQKESPSIVEALAGETIKGLEATANHNARIEHYAQAKARAVAMADYIRQNVPMEDDVPKIHQALNTCGEYLVFRDYYTMGKIKLSGICSCKKHFLCPLCAIRRGGKAVKSYMDRLEVLMSMPENCDFRAYLITLTVKDGPDLWERFKHLHKSVKAYHGQRRDALKGGRRRSPVEANKAQGAVWSYEVKKGKGSGQWHPHMHSIWLCSEPPDQVKLQEEWHAITGDSFIVDVTPFYTEPAKGFLEVFKYAVKFSDMSYSDTWEVHKTLSGTRMVASFGCFRGVKVPEVMTDDLDEDLPYIEMFYKFVRGANYYAQKTDIQAMTG